MAKTMETSAMSQKAPRRKILAVFNLSEIAGREILSGMLEAMSRKVDWQLHLREGGEGFTAQDVRAGYDGFIITVPGTADAMKALAHSKVPTVLANITDRKLSARETAVSRVWLDNFDIGKCAAEHFLGRGPFASAAFVHLRKPEFYSNERESGFRQSLRTKGIVPKVLPSGATDSELRDFLVNLPKPAAVMAPADLRAVEVIDACTAARIKVPNEVSVIGVDNDTLLRGKKNIAISSVQINTIEMGRRLVTELDHLFTHPQTGARNHEILVGGAEVVPRRSTAMELKGCQFAQGLLDYISEHLNDPLTPDGVAENIGCSRQLADLRLRQFCHATLHAAIENAKLEKVAKLLRTGRKSIGELAVEFAFPSANQLTRRYTRHFGHPPSADRKRK